MSEILLHIAIPTLNERNYLPQTINCIKAQDFGNYHIYICVNQPDTWWSDKAKVEICKNNAETLLYLNGLKAKLLNISIIDRSSKGNGWGEKKSGVGFARKTIMDEIIKIANDYDIIVSMDADIEVGSNYLHSLKRIFKSYPKAVALANPYYHKLADYETLDRPMLRYEIYMRCYTINLLRIKSPYSFTAFGSVISMPVWAYKKIRGITPKTSGEDFYLLQKLRKTGEIMLFNDELVYPATRISNRVPFGTGPAIAKTVNDLQNSYPVFHPKFFDEIAATYDLFNNLYYGDFQTPMSGFFKYIFKSDDIFKALRNNYKAPDKFINACHNKIDGLRIFQYLKWRNLQEPVSDNKSLEALLGLLRVDGYIEDKTVVKPICFANSPISIINSVRDLLFNVENTLRREHDNGQ